MCLAGLMNTTIKESTINVFVTKIQFDSKIQKGVMVRSRRSVDSVILEVNSLIREKFIMAMWVES